MSYVKKITNYISKLASRNKAVDNIEENNDFESKYSATVISVEDMVVNYKNLINFIDEKEFKDRVKMAQEKTDIKSKYIFGEAKDLF